MRPHVELIQEDDYVWHGAELPGGEGRASERRLSVDEEDGSSSLRIDFHTDWGRGPGIHHANTEYYVVEGEIDYGGQKIGKGGYVYAPKGVPIDYLKVAEGTKILHYREYGDAGFDPVDSLAGATRWADAREDVIVIDSDAMKWDAVPNPGPMPGLFIKYLHVDPVSGFYTRLVHAQEGWSDHRLAHHPCYEEAYTTQGHMEYNFGTLDLGTYFFRPARVKHGHFTTMEGGATWLLRSDGELANWYTQNEWVRWGGEGVNYGPNGLDESPHPARPLGALDARHGAAVAHRRGHAPDDRVLAVPEGPGPVRRPGRAPRLRRQQGRHRDRQGARRVQPAGRARRTRAHATRTTTTHDARRRPRPLARGRRRRLGLERRDTEHADERTDEHAHNWGAGRKWQQGDPIPAPILSSMPVRSRSRGRWDGDGM